MLRYHGQARGYIESVQRRRRVVDGHANRVWRGLGRRRNGARGQRQTCIALHFRRECAIKWLGWAVAWRERNGGSRTLAAAAANGAGKQPKLFARPEIK